MGHALTSALSIPGSASAEDIQTVSLVIEDMHCGACLGTVERALKGVPGVREARANLSARRATVTYDARRTGSQPLIDTLARGLSRGRGRRGVERAGVAPRR